MPTNDQVANIKESSRAFRNVNIMQAEGGFILQCGTQYLDPATNAVIMAENSQGVAPDVATCITMTTNYLTYNTFDSPQGNLGI